MPTAPFILPSLIDTASKLEWIAKALAKGILLGKHSSRTLGQGMEFEQYRPYVQGDDLRQLDWKMYAKSGKYFIRQSTIEANHSMELLIDNSPSMDYQEGTHTKLDIAKIIAATLSYAILRQGDSAALTTRDQHIHLRNGMPQWHRITDRLSHMSTTTDPYSYAQQSDRMLIWITDLYDTAEAVDALIRSLQGPGTELMVVHIMGDREAELDFDAETTFIDLETGDRMQVDAPRYRDTYRERLQQHLQRMSELLLSHSVHYHRVSMTDPSPEMIRSIVSSYHQISMA